MANKPEQAPIVYQCTNPRCNYEVELHEVPAETPRHHAHGGKVEMRRVKSIPGSYGDSLVSRGKYQSKTAGSE